MDGGGAADVDHVDRGQERVEAVVDPRPELLGELRGTGEAEAVELGAGLEPAGGMGAGDPAGADDADAQGGRGVRVGQDRKSTRLNSSHVAISYAVFCLKKKKQTQGQMRSRETPHK